MDLKYHQQITRRALGAYFDEKALAQIVAANLWQDSPWNQFPNRSYLHFDNNKIAEGLAYVLSEHASIIQMVAGGGKGAAQRAAFGRLCHTVQDFYAHSNYVDLWLRAHGGLQRTQPTQIDGLDPRFLWHPDLKTGTFQIARDFVYYIPLAGWLFRRYRLDPDSHEAMHLDSPQRGPRFAYAFVAACRRTQYEYMRLVGVLAEVGGKEALCEFRFR